MKQARRKKVYSPPSLELITYEQARSKIETEQRPAVAADRFCIFALYAVLLALPLLVLLSAVDPSGFLLHRVLRVPSPLVWNAWAFACFWAGLSSEGLLKKIGRKSPLRGNHQSFLFLLGLLDCISVVALLWLVGRPG
ncbi:MAG: hypothetical protein WB562_18300 [Candidatus Sulfotelmatobacter sp.]